MSTPNGSNGFARVAALASVAAVALTMLGSIFFLYQTATDAQSRSKALEAKVAGLQVMTADHQASLRVMRSDLREVETQFRASDQVRNLMHANDMRVQAMLWRKTYGQEYPIDNAFYPTIARDPPN